MGVDVQKPFRLGEQLVEVGDEVGPLAAARPGTCPGPVGAHAPDIARHRRSRQPVLTGLPVAGRQQEGARPNQPGGCVGITVHRVDRGVVAPRRRTLGSPLRHRSFRRVGDVLHVYAGRVGQ